MNDDLKNLDDKLSAIRGRDQAADDKAKQQIKDAENMSNGMRAGAELVGAIVAGAFIGFLLDGWLDTKPLFLIIMLVLGVITGFVNVYRVSQNIGTSVGYSELHTRSKTAKNSPDEKNQDH